MSGDSSLGIGIGLALKSYGRAVSYVKLGRVLDLSTPFSELTFTLDDRSGEGNDATLYTGRYISTDGSTDRGIVADCSAAGSGSYYLTGKVRPNAVTTAELTMDGSTDSGLTGLAADVWQDFTTATASVTPSAVQVGFDGTTASAADWSDVKLIDSSDGSTVARWQLTESADGDLDGYPALDSSGNGYHGLHTGCAGGTGEGIDADVAGAVYAANEDKMWFDGVNDYVSVTGMTASVSYFGACTISADIYVNDTTTARVVWGLGGSYRLFMNGGNWFVNANGTTGVAVTTGFHSVSVTYAANGDATNFNLDGTDYTITGSPVGAGASATFMVGARDSAGAGLFFDGLIYDFSITGSSVKNFAFAGNELGTWTDLNGVPANDGTVNGNPVTVGQKRETILQTAGQDWNRDSTTYTPTILVPERDALDGFDALGNAIAEPRVNNKQLNLFGDGEYALVSSNPSFQFNGPEYSIEAWVDAPAGNIGLRPIISLRPDSGSAEGRYILFLGALTPNNNISFLVDDGSAVVPSASKNTGNQQLVGVVDSTHVRLYKNGVLQDSVAHDGAWSAYVDDLYIGYDKTSDLYSDTKIGSPKIYNVALTADEVLQNYQSQKSQYGL